jgi:hypothetical protein
VDWTIFTRVASHPSRDHRKGHRLQWIFRHLFRAGIVVIMIMMNNELDKIEYGHNTIMIVLQPAVFLKDSSQNVMDVDHMLSLEQQPGRSSS